MGGAFYELMAEREAAQERARGIERRARLIADNLPALIGYINSEQRYKFANAHYKTGDGGRAAGVEVLVTDISDRKNA